MQTQTRDGEMERRRKEGIIIIIIIGEEEDARFLFRTSYLSVRGRSSHNAKAASSGTQPVTAKGLKITFYRVRVNPPAAPPALSEED